MESFMPTGAIAIAARLSIDHRRRPREYRSAAVQSIGWAAVGFKFQNLYGAVICSPQKRPVGHDCACITPIHPIGVQACYLLNSVPVQVGLPTPLPAYSPDTGLPYPGCYLVAVIFFTTENFP